MEHCPHHLWHRTAIFSALAADEVFRLVTFRMFTWEFSSSFPTPGTLPHVSATFRLYALETTLHVPHQERCVSWGPDSMWNPKLFFLLPDYHCYTFMGIFVLCFLANCIKYFVVFVFLRSACSNRYVRTSVCIQVAARGPLNGLSWKFAKFDEKLSNHFGFG
jgi:hypothetical protein